MFETFHFLRPEWFFALPIIALFLVLLNRHSSSQSGWEDVCDPALLAYQLAKQKHDKNNLKLQSLQLLNWITPLVFLIGIIALSGPSWEKKEQPVFQQGNALVIILDLSLSMNATDLKPSRLKRAKLKLIDILQRKKEGQTALIAFAGDAHTVSPLTIDNKTIMSLLPALNSSIMPLNGTHLLDALSTAKKLFKNAGFAQGDILLLSDGIEAEQFSALKKNIKQLHRQGYRFSVIGIGTSSGSPLPLPDQGGFIKDQDGQVVLSKLDPVPLKKLSSAGGGQYQKLSLDDSDFETLLAQRADQNSQQPDQDKQLEQWVDAGAYFTLLLIPLALMSFRKGLFSFILCLFFSSLFSSFGGSLLMTGSAYAETTESAGIEPTIVQLSTQEQLKETWKNLWTTPEQQAQKSFNNKDYQSAADQFSDNNWKASANYRGGDFKQALKQYSQSDDAHSLHNKGNTLANLKQYQEAIDAYEEALKKAPESDRSIQENTTKNLNYVKKILEQQKKQSSEKNSDKNKQDKNQQSDDQEKEQENSTDEGSKSNESEESEENKSDDSNSEGNDSKSDESEEDSSEKDSSEEDSSEKNSPSEKNTPDSPQSPEEAKSPEESNPEPKQEDQKELVNQSAQPEVSEKEEQDENQSDNADKTQQDVLSQLSQEEQQSLKQWLQRIPDNPGELLRIKFRNNTILKQRQSGSSETQYEGNPW